MCIRAIDYCAPVGITFGDYLRAVITADCFWSAGYFSIAASIFASASGESSMGAFIDQRAIVLERLILFWSWMMPYINASAVGGHPGT